MKYFVDISLGLCGHEGHDSFEADSDEQAESIGRDLAFDHAQSYFDVRYEQDEVEVEDEEDTWGSDYIFDHDISYDVVPYNAEEHDGYLY